MLNIKYLWLITHFNHAKEMHPDCEAAAKRLLRAGIPVLNQAVLLSGINDSVEAGTGFVFSTHPDPSDNTPATHPRAILTTFAFGVR